MSRRSLLSLILLSLAALAQDTAYGRWVTDPNNLTNAAFVNAPSPVGFKLLTASPLRAEPTFS